MIRNYNDEDGEAVKRLYEDKGWSTPRYEEYMVNIMLSLFKDCCFVYYDGSVLGGFIGAIASPAESTMFIYSMTVEAAHRRMNIGKRLIEAVILKAHKVGCTKLAFSVNLCNFSRMKIFEEIARKFNTEPELVSNYKNTEYLESVYIIDLVIKNRIKKKQAADCIES